jgi:hypothetical protein
MRGSRIWDVRGTASRYDDGMTIHPMLRRAVYASCTAGLMFWSAVPVLAADLAKPVVLTAQNVQTLPDSTTLTINGKSYTLAALRAAHNARLERFSRAASLAQSFHIVPRLAVPISGGKATTSGPKAVGPLKNILSEAGVPVPNDLQQFCATAAATACLYVPSIVVGGDNVGNGVVYFAEIDPLIFDPNVCASSGGRFNNSNPPSCSFFYPAQFLGNFTPSVAAGDPVTFTVNCPSPAQYTTDPHGAIKLSISTSTLPATTAACTVIATQ